MKFTFTPLELPDVLRIEHQAVADGRGSFSETYRQDAFREAGLPAFVQENHSRSARGVDLSLSQLLARDAQPADN